MLAGSDPEAPTSDAWVCGGGMDGAIREGGPLIFCVYEAPLTWIGGAEGAFL